MDAARHVLGRLGDAHVRFEVSFSCMVLLGRQGPLWGLCICNISIGLWA